MTSTRTAIVAHLAFVSAAAGVSCAAGSVDAPLASNQGSAAGDGGGASASTSDGATSNDLGACTQGTVDWTPTPVWVPSNGGNVLGRHKVGALTLTPHGPTAFVEWKDASNARHLGLARPSADVHEFASVAGAGDSNLHAAVLGLAGKTECAAYQLTGRSLAFACDDGTAEDTGIPTDVDRGRLLALTGPGDLVDVFGQSLAAFTIVERSKPGAWRELEQFESSSSWPEDGVVTSQGPLACFISSEGFAVLTISNARLPSATTTSMCRVALDGDSIDVLIDSGYAKIPVSQIVSAGKGGPPFDVTPSGPFTSNEVLRLVAFGGKAYVLTSDAATTAKESFSLVLHSIPTGPSYTLAEESSDGQTLWTGHLGSAYDDATGTLAFTFETEPRFPAPNQTVADTVHFVTKCMSDLPH